MAKKHPSKYELYEASVQTPETHLDFIERSYTEFNGRKPKVFREDFCGTYWISTEWIKRDPENKAIGLDIDPEPLKYGHENHLKKLSDEQKSRLAIKELNVLDSASEKADAIGAFNFSYCIFKDYGLLVDYFTAAQKSLNEGGIFAVELAGGPGMIEEMEEKQRHKKKGKHWFTYIWDQISFNPINHDAKYAIHFKMADGKKMEHAFEYDWRLWTIPETRAAMADAGFDETYVYWEREDSDGEGLDEYYRTESVDNDHTWICYIVGHKPRPRKEMHRGSQRSSRQEPKKAAGLHA